MLLKISFEYKIYRLAEACISFIKQYILKNFLSISIQTKKKVDYKKKNYNIFRIFLQNGFEFNKNLLNLLFEWLNIFYEGSNNTDFINEIVKKLIIKLPFSFIIQNEFYVNKLNKKLKYFINLYKIKYL